MYDIDTLMRLHWNGVELSMEQYKTIADNVAGMLDEIDTLKEDDSKQTRYIEVLEEQNSAAVELVNRIRDAMRFTTAKDVKAAISTALDDSMFEF